MSVDVVSCAGANMWNMSISMLFGKSPKADIKCGKCYHWFSNRFNIVNGRVHASAICPHCGTVNTVPIVLS